MSLWTDHFNEPPVGETVSRLAYVQKSEAHILHGRPTPFAAVRTEFLRSSFGRALAINKM